MPSKATENGTNLKKEKMETDIGKQVLMPNSPQNLIFDRVNGNQVTRSKWKIIEQSLKTLKDEIRSTRNCAKIPEAIELCIRMYNPNINCNFNILQDLFLPECMSPSFNSNTSRHIILSIIEGALLLQKLFPKPIVLLRSGTNCTLQLTTEEAYCLLCNAFFCTFPKREEIHEEYKTFPRINFAGLYDDCPNFGTNSWRKGARGAKLNKLKCLMNYFSRQSRKDFTAGPVQCILYERRYLKDSELVQWEKSTDLFSEMKAFTSQPQEQIAGKLKVDFANKRIGGGTLGNGSAMEEIHFATCPELVVTQLFAESMDDRDVILIHGFQKYSQHSGYGRTFEFVGDYQDKSPDNNHIVAMDAYQFNRNDIERQYKKGLLDRELNKCLCAFKLPRAFVTPLPTLKCVTTGKWGCGVFNGDPVLKCLIQMMAASVCGVTIEINTYGDGKLVHNLNKLFYLFQAAKYSVGNLHNLLLEYNKCLETPGQEQLIDLVSFIERNVNEFSNPQKLPTENQKHLNGHQQKITPKDSKGFHNYTRPQSYTKERGKTLVEETTHVSSSNHGSKTESSNVEIEVDLNKYVLMPNDRRNTIYTSNKNIQSKWSVIMKSLKRAKNQIISNDTHLQVSEVLTTCIQAYNPNIVCNFSILKNLLNSSPPNASNMFKGLIVSIIDGALKLPALFPNGIKLLRSECNDVILLTSEQCHCLLSNAFLCTFPKREKHHEEYNRYPRINFTELYHGSYDRKGNWRKEVDRAKLNKLKCFINYFACMNEKDFRIPQHIIFERKYLKRGIMWNDANVVFSTLKTISKGTFEKSTSILQVDFASKFVGGGTLGHGCAMEEIRFSTCPELVVSQLFTEKLEDCDVLLVHGFEHYSMHSGYRSTFQYEGNISTSTAKINHIVAMDALQFTKQNMSSQFTEDLVKRELNKCLCAFKNAENIKPVFKSIASGKWGCGVFNGDPVLKCLIQWMAASVCQVSLLLHTLEDVPLKKEMDGLSRLFTETNCTVDIVYRNIVAYGKLLKEVQNGNAPTLTTFLLSNIEKTGVNQKKQKSDTIITHRSYQGSSIRQSRRPIIKDMTSRPTRNPTGSKSLQLRPRNQDCCITH